MADIRMTRYPAKVLGREAKVVGEITDEIRELAREYDLMVSRIRDLMSANVREQEQKRKSDLKALQAQINPHFLYNTLDSIVWMAEMGKSPEVVKMTADRAEVASPGGPFLIVFSGSGKLTCEPSFYCPEFGIKIENTALAFCFSGLNMETTFRIETL